ncbi:MAG TPA: NADH-ubiquinone oxidoreductase-F iron-sulfur binding region domain-containing protein [Pirellulaceae bacterium]|nr:NADH-ubiquinone oxidoreductase-F iron-sulfur binding region domain-containing protein [Pirellulaceae bacterium]
MNQYRPIDDPQAVESFYHLHEAPAAGRACRGMACFAARHRNEVAFQRAEQDQHPIYCLGQCYAAPAVAGSEKSCDVRLAARQPTLLENVLNGPVRKLDDYLRKGGGASLEQGRLMQPDALIKIMEDSGLRGRGGAGFAAGRKWRAVREAALQSGRSIVVVNADEGDPGAFSDKVLLEDDPFRLLESAAIAAYAVGAREVIIYLRCEYQAAAEIMQQAISQAQAADWPGGITYHLHSGHGSFVCGEETSLLNSLERRRPFVRTRPPYPFQHGLHGQPTLVHNVETLCAVPWIVQHGAAAYRDLGVDDSAGTKLISLNSLFHRPGLVEVPFGISVRTIVEDIGGGPRDEPFWGVMIGGPLAGVLPPSVWDVPFAYRDLARVKGSVGHGGIVAFDSHTKLGSLMREVFLFGANESCGWCVPCHQGLNELSAAFAGDRLEGPILSRSRWSELVAALEMTSVCGHGRGLADFAYAIELHYSQELTAWLQ